VVSQAKFRWPGNPALAGAHARGHDFGNWTSKQCGGSLNVREPCRPGSPEGDLEGKAADARAHLGDRSLRGRSERTDAPCPPTRSRLPSQLSASLGQGVGRAVEAQPLLRDGQLDRGVDSCDARAILIGGNGGTYVGRATSVRRMANALGQPLQRRDYSHTGDRIAPPAGATSPEQRSLPGALELPSVRTRERCRPSRSST